MNNVGKKKDLKKDSIVKDSFCIDDCLKKVKKRKKKEKKEKSSNNISY